MTGDQPANAKEAVRIGIGEMVSFQELSEKIFGDKLNAVLTHPKYTNRAKEHGSLVVDQIEHPLQRATWWLEHVMRHPHEYRNKSPVHKLSWYQYFCLDVILILGVALALFLSVLFKIVSLCCCTRKTKIKQH